LHSNFVIFTLFDCRILFISLDCYLLGNEGFKTRTLSQSTNTASVQLVGEAYDERQDIGSGLYKFNLAWILSIEVEYLRRTLWARPER
jgi:hypothetical protein